MKKLLSDKSSEIFDVLVWANHYIHKIEIPSEIKYIDPYCFEFCSSLTSVTFSENSELETIGNRSFLGTNMNYFFIPKHVKCIEENVICFNDKLKYIEFQSGSEILILEKRCFCYLNTSNVEFDAQAFV